MTHLFLFFLNNSMAAGWLILLVILLRVALQKGPKKFRCVLWLLVGIRILCPISIESVVSLIPSSQIVPYNFGYMQTPAIDSGIEEMEYHLQYDGEKIILSMNTKAAELYPDYPYEQWILENEELESYMLRMGEMVQEKYRDVQQ